MDPTRTPLPKPEPTTVAAIVAALATIGRLAYDLARLLLGAFLAPLRRAYREARPCRREQLGYRCHMWQPGGCEECGREVPHHSTHTLTP